jgi:hypothetical protein
METREIITSAINYFTTSDHWRRLVSSLNDPDPHDTHIHSYVDTSIHPRSLEEIITGYFDLLGWPSSRRVDHMSPAAGMGSLHGIEPQGKPHFDFQWFFDATVGIQGSSRGESGCNLLIWNKWYIQHFYKDFQFRTVGDAEEKVLEEYFRSDHWHEGLKIVEDPDTNHMHINVETSVHPDVIAKFALKALKERGWEVFYVCPNVYLVEGKYRGKLVFMGRKPEEVYDIGWNFNPDVIIRPAVEPWIFSTRIGYDVWDREMLGKVMDYPYVMLKDAEIKEILDACRRKIA